LIYDVAEIQIRLNAKLARQSSSANGWRELSFSFLLPLFFFFLFRRIYLHAGVLAIMRERGSSPISIETRNGRSEIEAFAEVNSFALGIGIFREVTSSALLA